MGGKNKIANMGKDGLKEGTTISLGGKDKANPVGKSIKQSRKSLPFKKQME